MQIYGENKVAKKWTNGYYAWRQVSKITIEKRDNTEQWKAVRGFWDGSKKTDGRKQSMGFVPISQKTMTEYLVSAWCYKKQNFGGFELRH